LGFTHPLCARACYTKDNQGDRPNRRITKPAVLPDLTASTILQILRNLPLAALHSGFWILDFMSWYVMSDLPKSTNFDIGALCLDIPESMRKDCSIM
jgi:hypothetical protein